MTFPDEFTDATEDRRNVVVICVCTEDSLRTTPSGHGETPEP